MSDCTAPLETAPTARAKGRGSVAMWAAYAAGIVFLCLLGYLQRDRFLTARNDFVQLYAGSQLSGTPRLYEPEASKEVHRRELGVEMESVYYSRPPFYAFLLRPLGKLPYKTAYWIYQSLSALAILTFLWMWTPRRPELPVYASFCYPLLATIITGQDLGFVLLAAGAAVLAMRKKWDYTAGWLLALCAIKIHLFLLVPIVLLVHRRWRVLAGGAVAGAVLIAISTLSDGLDWPQRYRGLLANPELHPGGEHMTTLRGLVHAFAPADIPWLIAALSALVVLAVIGLALRQSFEVSLAFALVGGLLVGYHAYVQDCTILMLVFVLVMEDSKSVPLRFAAGFTLMPPLYMMLVSDPPWNAAAPVTLLALLAIGAFRSASNNIPEPAVAAVAPAG